MDKIKALRRIREKLETGRLTVGSWMQSSSCDVAELMGAAGFDWVVLDQEHGAFGRSALPDLCRTIELGGALPFVRVARGGEDEIKQALDAGASGVICPMVEDPRHLENIVSWSRWPPNGSRGVAFSRANLFGERFEEYKSEASQPFVVAMIETKLGVERSQEIAAVEGVDALMVGPYDLSASMGVLAQFESTQFLEALAEISANARRAGTPMGMHLVEPSLSQLEELKTQDYRFLAYSIDMVMLRSKLYEVRKFLTDASD